MNFESLVKSTNLYQGPTKKNAAKFTEEKCMVYFPSKPEEWMILSQPSTSLQRAVRTLFIHSKEQMLTVSTVLYLSVLANILFPANLNCLLQVFCMSWMTWKTTRAQATIRSVFEQSKNAVLLWKNLSSRWTTWSLVLIKSLNGHVSYFAFVSAYSQFRLTPFQLTQSFQHLVRCILGDGVS